MVCTECKYKSESGKTITEYFDLAAGASCQSNIKRGGEIYYLDIGASGGTVDKKKCGGW